ncbi:MAG: hypothetical protein HYY67_06845 [Thaumarchaeota archaeon]|nr:hypothetical protein [Nitrososphaerota archaeon]
MNKEFVMPLAMSALHIDELHKRQILSSLDACPFQYANLQPILISYERHLEVV